MKKDLLIIDILLKWYGLHISMLKSMKTKIIMSISISKLLSKNNKLVDNSMFLYTANTIF